ncbi:MAG: HD domain-containing protein [Pyrinomonadaceae bacterium]|nr:HD domain-containing protein [Pyrinomonadaceae bacterium]
MAENENKLIYTFGALAELGQEITNRKSFQEMIRTSLHLLLGSLAIMRGGVARYSRFRHELNFIAVKGLGEDFPPSFSLSQQDEHRFLSAGLAAADVSQASGDPVVSEFVAAGRNKPLEMFVPLVIQDELVGLITLGEKANGEPYSSYDREVICAMARHIGVGIAQRNMMVEIERRATENRRLYDDLRFTYTNTVKAFAAAIDYKDKYTEGHSVRVGKYTEIIAKQLGWGNEEIEGAAVAGYLHDIGKLTVERNIINSPMRINAKESVHLNKHPVVGYEILLPIHHPYADVPLAAKYHHERLDGRGYPDGLADREIPYIAKIVNLADSVDAMTTDRPYKRRRPAHEMIEDLQRNSGNQFAPELVTSFCGALLSELTGKKKRLGFTRMLGKEYLLKQDLIPQLQNVLNGLNGTSSMTLVSLD